MLGPPSPGTARLIIVLEGLKEVSVSSAELPLSQVHLTTTLCNTPSDIQDRFSRHTSTPHRPFQHAVSQYVALVPLHNPHEHTLILLVSSRHITSDDTHNEGVGDGGFDVQRLGVQGLQFLVVLLLCVHLNLKGIHLYTR